MRRHLYLIVIGIALILIAGCSDKVTEPANTTTSTDMGGFTATSELPAFGDPTLLADDGADSSYDDPTVNQAPMDSLINDPRVVSLDLRVIWGRLRYDSTVTEATDWTGRLSISRGGIQVRHLIRFEPGDELLPRTDRRFVDWVSHTTVSYDGIDVALYVLRPLPVFDTTFVDDSTIVVDTLPPEPIQVSFETGPYSHTFDLREIAALDTVVQLDDGNAVAFHGMPVFSRRCPLGFMAGGWGYDENGKGVFRGRWLNQAGDVVGHFSGTFGSDDAGQPRFYGKVIDRDGGFRAFIRGSYGPYPGRETDSTYARRFRYGWFGGEILNADRQIIGLLGGRFAAAENYQSGFIQGRWKMLCDRRPNAFGDYDFDDGLEDPGYGH